MNILWKKSYCELCKNSSCSDMGRRNIHFMDHNHCSRFSDGLAPNGFVLIPKGNYKNEDEEVVHVESFYISKYLVTEGEYCNFNNILSVVNKNKPVVGISWKEAVNYTKALGCKLPTKYQWSYVCEKIPNNLDNYAWDKSNSNNELQEVGKKLPNSFGLYDILGNVWEYTEELQYEKERCELVGGSYDIHINKSTIFYGCHWNITKPYGASDIGFRLVKDI